MTLQGFLVILLFATHAILHKISMMLVLCLILTLAIDSTCGQVNGTTTLRPLILAPYNETALQIFDDIDTMYPLGIMTQDEIDALYMDFDKNNDTTISRVEFQAAVDKHWPEFRGYENEVYCYFDIHHKGYLNETDFVNLLEMTDTNNDMTITQDEFLSVFPVLLQGLETLQNLSDMFHGHGHDDDACPI